MSFEKWLIIRHGEPPIPHKISTEGENGDDRHFKHLGVFFQNHFKKEIWQTRKDLKITQKEQYI